MSQQAYALGAKILEVEEWLTFAPCPVLEVHPEVSFAELLGAPASAPKKSWLGMVERYRALAGAGIYLEELTGAAARAAAVDDMLDAGVAAWTARRVHVGEARTLPSLPPASIDGRPVAIWV
jgi:predicted RNase H-like nuclease